MDSSNPTPPNPSGGASRSTIVGAVVVVLLLLAAGGIVLANVQGGAGQTVGKGPLTKNKKDKNKKKKSKGGTKSKEQTPAKSKYPKVPVERLVITGPDTPRPDAPAGARNVVVVIPTSVRRDHVSPYGADPALTPFLGEVAQQGARFADTISAGPFSRYATWAAFTGQYPAALGVVEPGDAPDGRQLPESVETLTEALRKSGWATFGVTANFNLNSSTGFAQGFDHYRDAQPSGFAPEARLEGPAAVGVALQMLKDRTPEEAARPFFLMVDTIDVHAPQRAAKDVVQKFQPDEPNALYRAAVYRNDTYLAELWKGLQGVGADATNTYFVVVGDHGEGIDDPPHHGKAHGRYLYPSSVAIPWLVMGPGIAPGRVVEGLSGSTDVMPTVLGLAGLPAPEGIDGRSWSAALTTGEPKTTRTTTLSDTWYFEANRAAIFSATTACQKDFGSGVMEHDSFVDGCFDRRTDAGFSEVKPIDPLMADLEKWRATVTPKVMEIPAINVPEELRNRVGGGEGKAGGAGKAGGKAEGKSKKSE